MLAFSKYLLISWIFLSSIFQTVFAANIAGLTGKYTCLTNVNFAPFSSFNIGTTNHSNNLSVINFDTMESTGISSVTINWGKSSPAPIQSNVVFNSTFSIDTGLIPGSYLITSNIVFVVSGTTYTQTYQLNMIPANLGNTLFSSQVPNANNPVAPETGICQKQ